jgi:hypothetical protein
MGGGKHILVLLQKLAGTGNPRETFYQLDGVIDDGDLCSWLG